MDFYAAIQDAATGAAEIGIGAIYTQEINKLRSEMERNTSLGQRLKAALSEKNSKLFNTLVTASPYGALFRNAEKKKKELEGKENEIDKMVDEKNTDLQSTISSMEQKSFTAGSSVVGAAKAGIDLATGAITRESSDALERGKQTANKLTNLASTLNVTA